jgi:hypothetical protein
MPIKSMSVDITYLSKIYYHSKFQGTVLSSGYASVTTFFFLWLACWFCSKQLRDTRSDIQSCSVCSSVAARQYAIFTVLESVHAPKKPVCDNVCELPAYVCVCVFCCARVVVVFRQLHRWQLFARNCALRRKKM